MKTKQILLVLMAFLGLASTSVAQERVRPLTDALPFYDRYLALPATTRDGFELRYTYRAQDGGAPPAMTLIRNGQRTPLTLGPGGRVPLPGDVATLRATQIASSGSRRGSITMDVLPVLPLARRIPVAAVNNSLGDYDAARRSAGPLAVAAPRLRGVVFPGITSGEFETADGRRFLLPRDADGDVVFKPGDRAMQGAVAITLPSVPTRVSFVE
jgi:hypothetical protein